METVLVVDDEKNYPLILGAVLEEEGFEGSDSKQRQGRPLKFRKLLMLILF